MKSFNLKCLSTFAKTPLARPVIIHGAFVVRWNVPSLLTFQTYSKKWQPLRKPYPKIESYLFPELCLDHSMVYLIVVLFYCRAFSNLLILVFIFLCALNFNV